MMYKESSPSTAFRKKIHSFWSFSGNIGVERFKVLPDGFTDLIIDLKRGELFVSGIMTSFKFRQLEDNADLIGVRFDTERFSEVLGIPVTEMKDVRAEYTQLTKHYNYNKFIDQLLTAENIENQIPIVEHFLASRMCESTIELDALVLALACQIRSLKGVVELKNIAQQYNIGTRQLERRFKKYMGLTMKEFASIVRFDHTKKMIESQPNMSLLAIAFDAGFSDHAHLSNEFKKISGENPSCFR